MYVQNNPAVLLRGGLKSDLELLWRLEIKLADQYSIRVNQQ